MNSQPSPRDLPLLEEYNAFIVQLGWNSAASPYVVAGDRHSAIGFRGVGSLKSAREQIRVVFGNCSPGPLRQRLAAQADILAVGHVQDLVDLFTLVPRTRADVAIVGLAGEEDSDLCRELLHRFPGLVLVGLPPGTEPGFVGLLWPRCFSLDMGKADVVSVLRWAVREPSCLEVAIQDLSDGDGDSAPEH